MRVAEALRAPEAALVKVVLLLEPVARRPMQESHCPPQEVAAVASSEHAAGAALGSSCSPGRSFAYVRIADRAPIELDSEP